MLFFFIKTLAEQNESSFLGLKCISFIRYLKLIFRFYKQNSIAKCIIIKLKLLEYVFLSSQDLLHERLILFVIEGLLKNI